jgi:hypothetical protein
MGAATPSVIKTEADLVAAFGGSGKMSITLDTSQSRVCNWRSLGIPPGSWSLIVEGALRAGIPGITFELLADIRKRRLQMHADLAILQRLSRSA